MTANKKGSKESRLSRYLKAPIRFLCKARDFYVRGMTQCSNQLSYVDAAMGCPTLPRSFSVGSTTSSTAADDYRELVRAASVRTYGNRVEPDLRRNQPTTVPRSRSVAIGRIDEDKPCEFGDNIKANPDLFPRSRSYGPHRRTGLF